MPPKANKGKGVRKEPVQPITEEPEIEAENPFVENAKSLLPYSESISALGNLRNRTKPFGTTSVTPPVLTSDTARGETDFVFDTFRNNKGEEIIIRTPRRTKTTPIIDTSATIPLTPTAAAHLPTHHNTTINSPISTPARG